MKLGSFFRKRPSRGDADLVPAAESKSGSTASIVEAAALRKRAEAGETQAQVDLAALYEQGNGVVQNFGEMIRWLRTAADQGSVRAQARLGEIYMSGRSVSASMTASAAAHIESGGGLLKQLFPDGPTIAQDIPEATRWNQLAANGGDPDAQALLGYQYATATGVVRDVVLAEKWFTAGAEKGNAIAQLGLGMLLCGGYTAAAVEGAEVCSPSDQLDFERGVSWLERAAAQGNLGANYSLGILSLRGQGLPRSDAVAAEYFMKAAAGGHPGAMFSLGELHRFGAGVTASISDAETWFRRAANRGHAGAYAALGRLLIFSYQPANFDSAAALYRQGADLGDGDAQVQLAQLYLNGKGVPNDAAEAVRWLIRAAETGTPSAFEILASLYLQGIGVEQDFQRAAELYAKASAAGSAEAEFQTGRLLLSGQGLTKDVPAALDHLRHAAGAGSAAASLMLGVLHANGEVIPQDYSAAAHWYGMAVTQGHPGAGYNLAFLHIRGLGVHKDVARGIAMLEEAARSGNKEAAWGLYGHYREGTYWPANPVAAEHWLQESAKMGSPLAVDVLAARIEKGEPIGMSVEQLLPLLERAASAGHIPAQCRIGRWLMEGIVLAKNENSALPWLELAAEGGDAQAQTQLADALSRGRGLAVDTAAALHWYLLAARQGHLGAAAVLLGLHHNGQAKIDDIDSIFRIWLKAAESGNPAAQRAIGDFYLKGVCTERSPLEGERWLRRAADGGDVDAQLRLAGAYAGGNDISQDFVLAARYFRLAAEQGHADAQYNFGVCCRRGMGVAPDNDEALRWYSLAADKGQVSAQLALGDLLVSTASADADAQLAEAAQWYRRAAEGGRVEALMALAGMYESGRGLPQDFQLALSFYRRAAAAGLAEAAKAVDRLSSYEPAVSTLEMIDTPQDCVIARLVSPSFNMHYPALIHGELIPPDTLHAMEGAWKTEKFEERDIVVSEMQDVYLVEDGLVFDHLGRLLSATIEQHSREQIMRAAVAVRAAMKANMPVQLEERAVLCKKSGAHNYGHWLTEMLPRAYWALQQTLESSICFLVPATDEPLATVIVESLALLGIREDQIVELGPSVTRVASVVLVEGLSNHGVFMSPKVIECCDVLARSAAPGGDTKLFVVRPHGATRQLINEEELSAYARDAGYRVVEPSTMTFKKQISLFKGAREVVGVMGSALTNLVFAEAGTRVACLAPATMPDTFFWFITGLKSHVYTEIRCKQSASNNKSLAWDAPLLIDRNDLKELFK